MKKYLIVLVMSILFVMGLSACGVVQEVPTVPMATITPTPTAIPSSMPSLVPSVDITSDITPQVTQSTTAGTTATSQGE